MPWKQNPDLLGIVGVFLISFISGFISIAQRIARGHAASWLWVISEFCAAILCGYLMWDVYPKIRASLPDWCTPLVMVALASHIGGRSFQEFESFVYRRLGHRPHW